jgi:hypothetical protein
MKIKIILTLLLILSLFGCNSNKKQVVFSGKIQNAPSSTIFLYQVLPDGENLLDSSPIKNGQFELIGNLDLKKDNSNSPCFYKIALSNYNYILTVASPREKLNFIIDSTILVKSYSVTGGVDAMLINQLDNQLKLFVDSVEILDQTYKNNQYNDSVKKEIETIYLRYVSNQKNFLINFIHKNPKSLTTLTAFYQKFNRRAFLPEKENISLLNEIVTNLESKYPENKDISFIKNRIQSIRSSK